MTELSYTIKDEFGIHARPAGMLVKTAKLYDSQLEVTLRDKVIDGKKLIAWLSLGARQGDSIRMRAEGCDEQELLQAVESFLVENL